MKKLLPVVLLFLIIKNSSAQPNWVWAKSAGAISNDYSNATCTDANGNVYITGTFQGSSIIFGSDTLHNTATGSLDIFVVKYDASGNVLWARSGGGTNNDYAYGICADIRGNVYITGYFTSPSITFGTINLNNLTSTGNGTDVYITKYDSAGNVIWAKSAGSSGAWAESSGICTDADSNVYITGTFGGDTAIFGSYTLINKGNNAIFMAKYDAGGNVLWAKGMGGTQENGGYGICTDAKGNVYITGYFQHKAFFGSDSIMGNSDVSIFVAKYDTYGNKFWAKSANGPGWNWNFGTGIAADASGNVYITGVFQNSVIFSDTLSNSGSIWSIYVAKYDSIGHALWGRSPGGTENDWGTGICTDASGTVFITGYFTSSFLNFGGHPVINANVGYNDIYVAAYDAGGNALWAKSVGGQDNDYGMGICSGGGSVYVTGYFGSYDCTFGSTTLTNNGSYDVFLAKLNTYTGIEENSKSAWSVFPNPSNGQFTIYGLTPDPSSKERGEEEARIVVYNVMGEKVYSQLIGNNYTNQIPMNLKLNEGIYFLQLTNGRESFTQKIIIE